MRCSPRAWGNLIHVLKTGEIPFDHVFGKPFFDYLAEHDEVGHERQRAAQRNLLNRFLGCLYYCLQTKQA